MTTQETASVASLRVADVYAMDIAQEDVEALETPQTREFSAYDVWDYHTSAEADMKWEMDKRKRWFEATMKQWKRIIEMSESGELR